MKKNFKKNNAKIFKVTLVTTVDVEQNHAFNVNKQIKI